MATQDNKSATESAAPRKNISRAERIEQHVERATKVVRENFPNYVIADFKSPEGKNLLFATAFVAGGIGDIKLKIETAGGITAEEFKKVSSKIEEAEKSMLEVCKIMLGSGYRPSKYSAVDKYVVNILNEGTNGEKEADAKTATGAKKTTSSTATATK